LPLELADVVVQRLRKFVLRARLKVDDVSGTMRVVRALQGAHDPRIAWGDRVLQLVPQGHAQFDDPGSVRNSSAAGRVIASTAMTRPWGL
jgi:hypothetical protein